MQAALYQPICPVACRLQRPLSAGLAAPAGLGSLGGRASKLARAPARSAAVVRASLEDAAGAAADGSISAFHMLAARLTTHMFLLGNAADTVIDAATSGADQATSAASNAASSVADAVSTAASAVTDAAPDAVDQAAKNSGFFGAFASVFESFIKILDSNLDKVGVPYSYGFSIILLTVLVKVVTYPLTKQQVESTLSMQALQPRVKELQAKFANDPERLQVETARVYQTAGVNPLAGCLPTLATIPVFIGLYKALSNVANEGLLTEGFFWIPSLAGPTTVNGGLGWLFQWENGAPALGWKDTAAYLVLPILLIVSQYVSQKVISPQQQSNDPAQQQTQAILKFLPLMIGWFSLNVPSGLTLYWFTNNLFTTAQQLYLRRSFAAAQAAVGDGPASSAVVDVEATEVDKKPSGKELNARRSSRAADAAANGTGGSGGSRGEKFRAIKAREAATRAAKQASSSNGAGPAAAPTAGAAQAEPASSPVTVATAEKEAAPTTPEEAEAAAQQALEEESSGSEEEQENGAAAAADGSKVAAGEQPKQNGARGKGKKKGGKKK